MQDWQIRFRHFIQSHEATVLFRKVDGSLRTLQCTLNPFVVPPVTSQRPGRTPNNDVCVVWDVVQDDWRAFRWDSVVKVELVHDTYVETYTINP